MYEELQSASARGTDRRPLLAVGYNRRFSPLARLLKQALAQTSEPFAAVYRVNAGAVPATAWVHDPEAGGGRIIGECCHFVDFLTFLAGGPPVSLTATALQAGGRPVHDVVTLTLQFPGGSLGTIHYFANGNAALPKEFIEVHAGGISAELPNFRSLKLHGTRVPGRKSYFNQAKGYAEEGAGFRCGACTRGPAAHPVRGAVPDLPGHHPGRPALRGGGTIQPNVERRTGCELPGGRLTPYPAGYAAGSPFHVGTPRPSAGRFGMVKILGSSEPGHGQEVPHAVVPSPSLVPRADSGKTLLPESRLRQPGPS